MQLNNNLNTIITRRGKEMISSAYKPIFKTNSNSIGAKAKILIEMDKQGFNIPLFTVVPSSQIEEIVNNRIKDSYFDQILSYIKTEKIIIRSSTTAEDTKSNANAGQFKSIVQNKNKQKLIKAIKNIYEDARKKTLGGIAVIIQEYILPDIFGVAFSRNPANGIEMIVEYAENIYGEDLVSGKIIPNKILITNELQLPRKLQKLNLFSQCRKIEKTLDFPVDIEWIASKGKLFIVQARPITTLNDNNYSAYKYIEKALKEKNYIFEKGKLSESIQTSYPINLSLLEKLYAENGPIDKSYAKFGIRYRSKQFWQVFGSSIYTNLIQEAQTIFPTAKYNYKKNKIENSILSVRNTYKLFRINPTTKLFDKLQDSIIQKLISPISKSNLEKMLENFLVDYEIVFQSNLLAGIAESKWKIVKNKFKLDDAFSLNLTIKSDIEKLLNELPSSLKGNSIDLSDKSDFITFLSNTKKQKSISRAVSEFKFIKNYILKTFAIYSKFEFLRELSRILTVKMTNSLRSKIEDLGLKEEDWYFMNFDELISKKYNLNVIEKRRSDFDFAKKFEFPNVICSHPQTNNESEVWLSGKSMRGTTIALEDFIKLNDGKNLKDDKYILLVDNLTPDLTQYFSSISGIITTNGGVLSHLSIMARQSNIPVVRLKITKDKINKFIHLGKKVI